MFAGLYVLIHVEWVRQRFIFPFVNKGVLVFVKDNLLQH